MGKNQQCVYLKRGDLMEFLCTYTGTGFKPGRGLTGLEPGNKRATRFKAEPGSEPVRDRKA